MHINVTPLLLNLLECFTTLIFYEKIDYGPLEFPIATMTPRYASYPKSACNITIEEGDQLSPNQNNYRICKKVLQHYNIKGTRCVGVMTVYPPDGYGERDIYWYLNYYWSRSENQPFIHSRMYAVKSQSYFVPVFPTKVQVQVLLSRIELRPLTAFKNLKYEWIHFARVPIVVISVSEERIQLDQFDGMVGIIFIDRQPVHSNWMKFNSSSGISSSVNHRIQHIRKYTLKVVIVTEKNGKVELIKLTKVPRHRSMNESPLHAFLMGTFNSSKVKLTNSKSYYTPTSLWTIFTYERSNVVHDVESDEQFSIGEKHYQILLTCSGLTMEIHQR